MSDEQMMLLRLYYLLGLAIGCLENLRTKPYDVNAEAVGFVLDELRAGMGPAFIVKMNETKDV